MQPDYIQKGVSVGAERLEIYGAPYGAKKDQVHTEQAIVVGSSIPGGLFVSYSPDFVAGGDCAAKAIILPDLSGESLVHNDRVTTFVDSIADVLKDDKFKFAGVTAYAGDTCPAMCEENQCCPFGYPDDGPQHNNYWSRLSTAQVITQGPVKVYNESDVNMMDDLHVVVAQIDGEPCRFIGAVTNTADAGTQPLDVDYRLLESATAQNGVWIELGRK